MAEYCDNSSSKCPPFAAHMRENVHTTRNCIVNDCLVNAMPNMQKTLIKLTTLV